MHNNTDLHKFLAVRDIAEQAVNSLLVGCWTCITTLTLLL